MTSPVKPEVHNVSQHCQKDRMHYCHRRSCTKIGEVRPCSLRVMRADRQIDRQTD